MSEQILLTKLFVPTPRVDLVPRRCLIERLNNSLITGCNRKLYQPPTEKEVLSLQNLATE